MAVINNMAGGRNNLESGLQTGLDIVATLAWMDWNSNESDMTSEEDSASSMSVGSGSISGILFTPWFLGMFAVVGFISVRRDKFQLGMILEDDSEESGPKESESEGKTLIDNYRARVLTLCALYVAQGIPWGFITVTFVTFLAVEGVCSKGVGIFTNSRNLTVVTEIPMGSGNRSLPISPVRKKTTLDFNRTNWNGFDTIFDVIHS